MAREVRFVFGFVFAIVFIFIGGVAVYLLMSVPRDVASQQLLKTARTELGKGKRLEARKSFETIVRDYPRTDAAGAAAYALFKMVEQDRGDTDRSVERLSKLESVLKTERERLRKLEQTTAELSKKVNAPPPPPPKITKPKVVPKKSAPRKTTRQTTRRRG